MVFIVLCLLDNHLLWFLQLFIILLVKEDRHVYDNYCIMSAW